MTEAQNRSVEPSIVIQELTPEQDWALLQEAASLVAVEIVHSIGDQGNVLEIMQEAHTLGVLVDSNLVGAAVYEEPDEEGEAFLHYLVVHPSFRDQKLGKIMLDDIEGRVSEMGATGLSLEASSHLQVPGYERRDAATFFEHHGYIQTELDESFVHSRIALPRQS